ncbi:MAG: NUDIX hydrolase [Paracoccaceae bacterium]
MKRNRTEDFTTSVAKATADQCGALCWRMHRQRIQVLLITSRDTGRWIIPKGWLMDGKTPADAAAVEAWEEAGVTGKVSADLLGVYAYDKIRDPHDALPCIVTVFALRVAALADKFPERGQRRRKWFNATKAARKVAEPELRGMLANLGRADGTLIVVSRALHDA